MNTILTFWLFISIEKQCSHIFCITFGTVENAVYNCTIERGNILNDSPL